MNFSTQIENENEMCDNELISQTPRSERSAALRSYISYIQWESASGRERE